MAAEHIINRIFGNRAARKAKPLSSAIDDPMIQTWLMLSPSLKEALVYGWVKNLYVLENGTGSLTLKPLTPSSVREAIELDLQYLAEVL
jgi:hypothetical protein